MPLFGSRPLGNSDAQGGLAFTLPHTMKAEDFLLAGHAAGRAAGRAAGVGRDCNEARCRKLQTSGRETMETCGSEADFQLCYTADPPTSIPQPLNS